MSNCSHKQHELNLESQPALPYHMICNGCAFHIQVDGIVECTHPEEGGVDCTTVKFCSSFQPNEEIDNPCVSFD